MTILRSILLLAVLSIGACRHSAPTPLAPAAAAWPQDDHCWWTAIRTTLPADSVGRRFADAFASLGLKPVISARVGDTLLVRGGPGLLGAPHPPAAYAARMVAFPSGDSTRFRWFKSIVPPAGGDAALADSASATARGIGFCGEIGKAVAIQGWAPRDPTREDSLAVWSRVP
jgi:hypothetical protein